VTVLIDTSVWIRFVAGKAPHASGLERLLEQNEAVAHELVFGELLIGDRGGRSRLLAAYERIQHARPVPHAEVATFVRSRRLQGRGLGWIDAHLLASAIIDKLELWTADTAQLRPLTTSA
jgi:predicted nucleic acid-binding protein